MNEKLYESLLYNKITIVVNDFASESNKDRISFTNYCRDKNLNLNINFNTVENTISIPNKGKVYFITTGSYEKILSLSIDNYFYKGSDKRVNNFLNSRLK